MRVTACHASLREAGPAVKCLDCAGAGRAVDAVAVCAGCGAGVCRDHAQIAARWLTRSAVINRTVTIDPPARIIRCGLCQQACDAAAGQPGTAAAPRERS